MRSKLAGKEEGFEFRTARGCILGSRDRRRDENITKRSNKIQYKEKKNDVRSNTAGDIVEGKQANGGWDQKMKKGPSFCKSNLCVAKPEMLVMML